MTSSYLVVVERNGQGWRAEIEGVGRVRARDLREVEPKARKLVWASKGDQPDAIELHISVRLPTAVQMRLSLAEQLCEEATLEVERAITYLVHLGVSPREVGHLLRNRREDRVDPRQRQCA